MRRWLKNAKYAGFRKLFEPYAILILLFIGCYFTLIPITCKTALNQSLFDKLPDNFVLSCVIQFLDCAFSNLYVCIQALVLQNDLPGYFKNLYESLAGNADIFSVIYNALITIYLVALPAMLAFVAIDAFADGLKEVLLQLYLKRSHTVYAFNAPCKNATSLAADIVSRLERENEKKCWLRAKIPLLLFSTADAEDEAESARVKDIAEGYARVRFTKVPFEEIPAAVFKKFEMDSWGPKARDLHLIAISDDCDRNVRDVIQATDQVVKHIELHALGSHDNDVSRLVVSEKDDDGRDTGDYVPAADLSALIEGLNTHLRLVCLHSNPDDDLVFDSLPQRGPKPEVTACTKHLNDRSDKLYKQSYKQLEDFERAIRRNMEVRLLNGPRQEIFKALTDQPLYRVLDEVDLRETATIKHQLLVVIVAGLGDRGIQALRSAYWFARLPGVELRIIGVDQHADDRVRTLAGKYPAMMAERVPQGYPSVYPKGVELGMPYLPDLTSGKDGLPVPTVRLCKMDAMSHDFNRLISGEPTESLAFDPGDAFQRTGSYVSGDIEARDAEVLVPPNARVYAFTTLGDDELNLSCALQIMRLTLNRAVDNGFVGEPRLPVICPCIRSDEVLDSVSHLMGNGNGEDAAMRTGIICPFGSSRTTFTYKTVIDSAFEKSALQLSAAYSTSYKLGVDTVGTSSLVDYLGNNLISENAAFTEYNRSEVSKLSSRCSTHFIPYRLWMMGYKKEDINEFKKASEASADMLKSDASYREMLEKERRWFEKQGLGVLLKSEAECTPEEADKRRMALRMLVKGKPRSEHSRDEYTADEEEYRKLFPIACAFADMEHARWLANYEALGWTPVMTEDQERYLNGIEKILVPAKDMPQTWMGKTTQRKSEKIHRHSYMVRSAKDQLDHGYRMEKNQEDDRDDLGGEDPFALDRIINTFTIRILYRRATGEAQDPAKRS